MMHLWFAKAVAGLGGFVCIAACLLWMWSYRSPEPGYRVLPVDGGTGFGSRQGYIFVTVDEPAAMHARNGPGSAYFPSTSRPFPGVEREVVTFPIKTSTTRVRWWLVVVTSTGASLAALLAALAPRWRAAARKRRGRCTICGYDLRGSPSRCPECGDLRGEQSAAA